MTCRHGPGDTSCSSHPDNIRAREYEYAEDRRKKEENEKVKLAKELYSLTPDSHKYEIVDAVRVGNHLVLKVQYPNCSKCSYEGNKVMVFLNVSEMQVLKWKVIDPHFRAPNTSLPKESPGPNARFPASKEGWEDALAYAASKK